ncbi:Tyrosine recombinase XerC [compost metagenome]
MGALAPSKYLTPTEQQALRKTLPAMALQRDAVMIQLLLEGGMRCQEMLNIRLEDLVVDTQSIFIKGLKGSSDRTLPFQKALFDKVYALAVSNPNGIPFSITYKRLQQIWYIYRPVNKKAHSLRHTFAINLYAKTKDLLLVQYALGHKNNANTLVYAKHITITQSLREAMLSA